MAAWCKASLSEVPVVSGLAQQLQGIFPEEPALVVQTAVADGLLRAIGDESVDLDEVTCNRDYSGLCPEGGLFSCSTTELDIFSICVAGWAEAGDGSSCMAPQNYQGAGQQLHTRCFFLGGCFLFLGECARKLDMGSCGLRRLH